MLVLLSNFVLGLETLLLLPQSSVIADKDLVSKILVRQGFTKVNFLKVQ